MHSDVMSAHSAQLHLHRQHWKESERETIEDLLESLGLPSSYSRKTAAGILRRSSPLDRLHEDLLRPYKEGTRRRDVKRLKSFAHFVGLDANEEFWELKCLLVALSEHPYFDQKGNPTVGYATRPSQKQTCLSGV